jgi:hypothetical protein
MHRDQATPARAEEAFGFLVERGFHLHERRVSGGKSVKDGWRLDYAAPGVTVTVQYLDMEFDVLFAHAGLEVDYLFIDRELFGRRSGLQGNMFGPQTLGPIIDRVAADIREHFGPVIDGDPTEWARIRRLFEAPKTKVRRPRRSPRC